VDKTGGIQAVQVDLCTTLKNGQWSRISCKTQEPYQEPVDLEKYVREHQIMQLGSASYDRWWVPVRLEFRRLRFYLWPADPSFFPLADSYLDPPTDPCPDPGPISCQMSS